mgnify:CR=1 FL=1
MYRSVVGEVFLSFGYLEKMEMDVWREGNAALYTQGAVFFAGYYYVF